MRGNYNTMKKLILLCAFILLAACDDPARIARNKIADAGSMIRTAKSMGGEAVDPSELASAENDYQIALKELEKESKAMRMRDFFSEDKKFKENAAKKASLAQEKAERIIKKIQDMKLNLSSEEFAKTMAGSGFKIGPEDVMEISVWKEEGLTKQVVVRPDGKISFPLVGDIIAKDRTVEQLRQDIKARLQDYVPDAPVSVTILKVVSPRVYVVGKVAKPGVYIMGSLMRVMDLLSMVGGMDPFADKDSILILRQENSRQIGMKFNYTEVVKGKNLEQNIILKPGDTVIIP
ncbi:polysaccharide biosynthesis/export protein [Candidatus Magnetomoraceae bacterium gMMP-15]